MAVKYIKSKDTLIEVMDEQTANRLSAVLDRQMEIEPNDVVHFSAKAFWSDEHHKWGLVRPIRWNSHSGAGPIEFDWLEGAEEIDISHG